jgi:very-short-patch-repair endonuclease
MACAGATLASVTIDIPPGCRELLVRQSGLLARWQAAECGLSHASVDQLLRSGRWQYLYAGVYAGFTGTLSGDATAWAALLRCGPDAVLSHFTAAELDGIRGRRTEAIHVTIPGQRHVRGSDHDGRNGLRRITVHRSDRIAAATHPAKSPPRTRVEETVLDLTELARDVDEVFHWIGAACAGRHTTPARLAAAVAERARLRWRADVLAALGEVADGVHTPLERRYVRNVELAHGLPKANRQARRRRGTRSVYLDNEYPDFGVVVELDGIAFHLVEDRWQDLHRDNYLARDDFIVLHYSWADITTRPCEVAIEIALVLRGRGWTGWIRRCPACSGVEVPTS